MIRLIDSGPLLGDPSRGEIAHYRAAHQTDPAYSAGSASSGFPVVVGLVGGLITVAVAATAVSILNQGLQTGAPAAVGFGAFTGILALGLAGATVWSARRVSKLASGFWPRWTKLDAFARANGLVFSPSEVHSNYPGAVFTTGDRRTFTEHMRSANGRVLDYGNVQYAAVMKRRRIHTWGYLALQLDRSLPHMVLDASGNNRLFGDTSLPASFDRSHVLSLEGDFPRFFTLYCPAEYERDALYVFTPDLMALLIDTVAPLDVEIIDRWMFVYSTIPFDLAQPGLHQRMLQIVDTVGSKTLTQTDRYVDERIGDFATNLVAPQGQRLRRRIPTWAILVGSVVAAMLIVPLLIALVAVVAGG